jgi:hypothetical protein
MLTRTDVEKVISNIRDTYSNINYDLLAVKMFTLVVRVLLDIREELSEIRQTLTAREINIKPHVGEIK